MKYEVDDNIITIAGVRYTRTAYSACGCCAIYGVVCNEFRKQCIAGVGSMLELMQTVSPNGGDV